MLKKTIAYTDFNNIPQVEDFYFNLSVAELTELQLSHPGGFKAYLQRAIDSEDGRTIMATFKEIIGMSVGQKSDDGKRFIKSEKLREDFFSSDAYSILFMELVTDANAASDFVNGIVPQNLEQQVNRSENARKASEASLKGRMAKAEPEIPTWNQDEVVLPDVPSAEVQAEIDAQVKLQVEAALRNQQGTQGYQSQNLQ